MKATDYCKNVFDGTHDTPKPAVKGYKLLTSKNILNGRLDKEDAYYISVEDYDAVNQRSRVKQWDVLFSMIGTVGNVCLVTDEKIDFAIKNMGDFSCEDEERAKWLYYSLQGPYAKKLMENYLNGAVQKFLPLGWLRDLDIPEYDAEKKSIVGFLWDIDSKIANNNAICSNLEAMAKLLYDYWFVQFDFPDENGKPYKSSGGKMVWNDELNREIPAGWEAGVLGDVIEKYTDGISSSNIGDLPYTPMDILPMRQMSFSEAGSQDDANSSLIRYKKYSLLFGAMRPYFHRVCIAPFDGITRTTVFTLRERTNGELGYAFETLNQDYTVNYANAHHVGTQQPYAEWDGNLEKCPIPLPPADLRRKYSQMISDHIDVVIERNLENQQLASLRDFLLPMLMNGQVKVGDHVS